MGACGSAGSEGSGGAGGAGDHQPTTTSVGKDETVGVEIRYVRSGGQGNPPEAESITIAADGSFEAHRSVGAHAAGRFAGQLPGELAERVARATSAVAGAAPPDGELMPGAPRETIAVDGAEALDVSRASGQPWMDLRTVVMEALETASSSPADAVVLNVSAGAPSVRLDLVGNAAIEGESSVVATALLWSEAWEERTRSSVRLVAGEDVALSEDLAPSPGDRLQVTVTLTMRTAPERPATPVELTAEAVAAS